MFSQSKVIEEKGKLVYHVRVHCLNSSGHTLWRITDVGFSNRVHLTGLSYNEKGTLVVIGSEFHPQSLYNYPIAVGLYILNATTGGPIQGYNLHSTDDAVETHVKAALSLPNGDIGVLIEEGFSRDGKFCRLTVYTSSCLSDHTQCPTAAIAPTPDQICSDLAVSDETLGAYDALRSGGDVLLRILPFSGFMLHRKVGFPWA